MNNSNTKQGIQDWRNEFKNLLTTNEVYRDVLGKWGQEITRNFIRKIVVQERKKAQVELIGEIERIVKDEAHRKDIKVGTSAFGTHYWICSELDRLKQKVEVEK